MPKSPRAQTLLAGILGGLVVLVIGAILLATDVIDTGDTTSTIVRQAPVERPETRGAAARGDDGDALTVNDIYRRVGPGVVFIEARSERRRPQNPLEGPEGGAASGSGFVLDEQGFIVTNAHVVEGADKDDGVRVTIGEADPIDARIVGSDPSTDIAVLKVDPKEARNLVPLELADSSDVSVGDPAIAVGNPFGLENTVTTGIVSALQRQIDAPNGFSIDNVIQTDASINPGNSGGPLLDGAGRVIGVNSQIVTGGSGRGSVGIGFAVPSNTVREVVPKLKQDGEIKRAFLGVTTVDVSRLAEDLNLPQRKGALVQEVVDGGPADRAGLRAGRTETSENITLGGDLIVKVDGKDISEPKDVADAIADNKPGDTVEIEFFRGNDRETVKVKLGERPDDLNTGPRGGAPEPDEDDEGSPFPLP
jgi:S1-C subfamily serine protease